MKKEDDVTMRIGYLINQYPKISHTFVRTEIEGHEACGTVVERYSIRPSPDQLIDPKDISEQVKTRILVNARTDALLGFLQMLLKPVALTRALAMTVRIGFRSERGLLRHFAYLLEACALRRWASAAGVQHIHSHFGTNSTAVAMLCRVLGGPGYSFTVHGPEEFDKPGLISLATKIEHATFVVAVSEFGRAQLWRLTDAADWDKIHVVRCGVDQRFLSGTGSPVPDVRRFICIGRLSEQKGQLVLLRAAAELKNAGVDFEIVMIGDGELRDMLEKAIDEFGLQANIKLVGWQTPEQIRDHIESSRAVVIPSFAEGLPVVIMEALALRRPVISTYIAGIPELVIPGETGWLVPAGAVQSLVAAMVDALECSTDRLQEMGDSGHTAVSERHDATKNAVQLNSLIGDVIDSKRR
jgi:glycosyltransferase involved in cell wall biosynthesis